MAPISGLFPLDRDWADSPDPRTRDSLLSVPRVVHQPTPSPPTNIIDVSGRRGHTSQMHPGNLLGTSCSLNEGYAYFHEIILMRVWWMRPV